MKLNKYQKQAFVSAVMQDVPDPRGKALVEEAQAAVVKAMSPLCRKLYEQSPGALVSDVCIKLNPRFHSDSYRIYYGDVKNYREVLKPFYDRVNAYTDAKGKLESLVEGINTLKQLQQALPEFVKYMPGEQGPTPNLPAVSGVVEALVALGWKVKP